MCAFSLDAGGAGLQHGSDVIHPVPDDVMEMANAGVLGRPGAAAASRPVLVGEGDVFDRKPGRRGGGVGKAKGGKKRPGRRKK